MVTHSTPFGSDCWVHGGRDPWLDTPWPTVQVLRHAASPTILDGLHEPSSRRKPEGVVRGTRFRAHLPSPSCGTQGARLGSCRSARHFLQLSRCVFHGSLHPRRAGPCVVRTGHYRGSSRNPRRHRERRDRGAASARSRGLPNANLRRIFSEALIWRCSYPKKRFLHC